jgi:hypothetical protein
MEPDPKKARDFSDAPPLPFQPDAMSAPGAERPLLPARLGLANRRRHPRGLRLLQPLHPPPREDSGEEQDDED